MTLTQPPYSLAIALFLSVPVAVWLQEGVASRKGAFAVGWGLGFGYFAAGLYWIGEAFLVDAEQFAWMLPFVLTLMPAGLALFWGAAFALARALGLRGVAGAAALAGLWTLAEFARGTVLTGFPWALPGYAWVETPVMQIAGVFGPFGATLLALAAPAVLAASAPWRSLGQRAAGAAAIAAVALAWGWGALRLADPAPAAGAQMVRIVQPNVAQTQKWRPENARWIFERLLSLSGAEDGPAPDIVLWPESAVPFRIEQEAEARRMIAEALPEGASLILGSLRVVEQPGRRSWRNSVYILGPDGEPRAFYDKQRLVPFGEYLPLRDILGAIGLRKLTEQRGGFDAGDAAGPISAPGVPAFLPLICYEAIFPGAVRAAAPGATWIAHLTNDAWFGDSIGPAQHLAQARVRAIETGLPVMRAANTGVSAAIDPYGRVLARLELGVAGAIDQRLPAALAPPPYARLGDWPALLAAVLALGFGLAARRRA